MSRPSFSDNPVLKVSRPVSACSRCRSAKVKCDGKLPACTACEKAGRENECSAANDQFARGKERSYVAALELRIERLQRRLEFAKSRKASISLHEAEAPPTVDPSRRDSLAAIRAAIHRKAARSRENSDINALVSDFGYLCINATTRDFEPSVTNMTFARLVLAASAENAMPEPKSTDLPPKQMAYDLVHYYMTNIYALYPAFPSTAIFALLEALYREDEHPARSSEYWLFWMVLAIASSAQSRSMDDDYYLKGVECVGRALPYADRALMPGYITQIQSLLLLTQYSMLDPAHLDAWYLVGFTCRAVIDLGFHQDPPQTQPLDKDKDTLEARRRTFYCVYALDRAISMVHARAFSFTDDSISVELPSASRTLLPSSGGGPLSGLPSDDPSLLLFKLRRLQSHWYQTLFKCDPAEPLPDANSFIWQQFLQMREWRDGLSASLPLGALGMFELELRYSYVYCLTPSERGPRLTTYDRVLIFEHAIAYMDRIYRIATADKNISFYTYHDALKVYFMGSQFVAVLRDAGDVLLSGSSVPMPPPIPGKAPPPRLPERLDRAAGGDNVDRSLYCLERVALTLKRYGERWDSAVGLMNSFDIISAGVIEQLKARRNARDTAASQVEQAHNQQSVPPHQGQQAPGQQEVRWVDVDVAKIIRNGGQI
ncbi:fungal-specific transcription factor domain-containing protein [Diplogelasinospora grovesii]|uniref:Fungal-specific transcription factor domain-containing protein n=1 Tax=Diplogelasinospora grovesii TaxID=303347 RepID=A0AAN6S345_9PEZI|nr:fungal-specific transcription factor domain-containing protein [Diplogelasinospora grovesii]